MQKSIEVKYLSAISEFNFVVECQKRGKNIIAREAAIKLIKLLHCEDILSEMAKMEIEGV